MYGIIFSLFHIQAGNKFYRFTPSIYSDVYRTWSMHLGNDILSYCKYKYETLLGANHLTFDGGGGG